MRRLSTWGPLLALLALAGLFLAGLGRDPKRLPSTRIDQPAPAFALPDLPTVLGAVPEGAKSLAPAAASGVTVADTPGVSASHALHGPQRWAGQVWLLNVFASWCSACLVEHPHWLALARRYPQVPVIGLAYKDEPRASQQWLDRQGNPYAAVLVDRSGLVGIDYGVYGVPETFVIDAQGLVRHRHVGPIDEQFMARHVLPWLSEGVR